MELHELLVGADKRSLKNMRQIYVRRVRGVKPKRLLTDRERAAARREATKRYRERHPDKLKADRLSCIMRDPRKHIFRTARARARKRGLDFDITVEDIVVPDRCPVFGMEIRHKFGSGGADDRSPSLDRIDPSKGYIKGNIRVISHRANRIKSDASKEELVMLVEYVHGRL